jgi:hypothetical protein
VEKEPNKEPLEDDCANCDKRYSMTPENSVVFHFTKQSECDYIFTVCDHCKLPTRIFLVGDETYNRALQNGFEPETEEYAPESIWETWMELNELPMPEFHELTPRQEAKIASYGKFLQFVNVDVTDFQ